MKNAIELVRRSDPDGEAVLYACPSCGTVYSPRIYAGGDGHAAAKAAAEKCRSCKPHNDVRKDSDIAQAKRRQDMIAEATEVTDLHFCFSDDGDNFYPSVQDAAEAGELGVFGSVFHPYRIDAGSIIESTLSNHHEDASENEMKGLEALYTAIDAFNAQQTQGSYTMDKSLWQKIPQTETFAMIKPDATKRSVEDKMIADIEAAGFRVKNSERRTLERSEAEYLYDEHRRRDHFNDLVDYTISGEVVLLHLESDDENTPAAFRKLMGATDHTKADAGTLRAKYAIGYRENSVHGSDSPQAAINELGYFFD